MKRISTLLMITLAIALGSIQAAAQASLKINEIFGGKYIDDPTVTETIMSGQQKFLRQYHLCNLATFKGAAETYAGKIQPLVLADAAKARGRNVKYRNGRLSYGYFILEPIADGDGNHINRYIYYLINEKSQPSTVTLIYFDGHIGPNRAEYIVRDLSKEFLNSAL